MDVARTRTKETRTGNEEIDQKFFPRSNIGFYHIFGKKVGILHPLCLSKSTWIFESSGKIISYQSKSREGCWIGSSGRVPVWQV
jgi:hypothetical protein